MGMILDSYLIRKTIDRALEEDLGWGDLTTDFLFHPNTQTSLDIMVREEGILAGLPLAIRLFLTLDQQAVIETFHQDGSFLTPGTKVASVHGSAAALLKAERTALNFLQHLSGIATQTNRFIRRVREISSKVRIVDTRKTTPGLRYLEKYAVRIGGGHNHRYNLSDAVMLKDNHLAILRQQGLSLTTSIQQLRDKLPHTVTIEVEVDTLDLIPEILAAGVQTILLDNMSCETLSQAVKMVQGQVLLEASGNMTLDRVAAVAATGIDLISVGSLTHSVKALDIGFDYHLA